MPINECATRDVPSSSVSVDVPPTLRRSPRSSHLQATHNILDRQNHTLYLTFLIVSPGGFPISAVSSITSMSAELEIPRAIWHISSLIILHRLG
jgi:hypothetical protein